MSQTFKVKKRDKKKERNEATQATKNNRNHSMTMEEAEEQQHAEEQQRILRRVAGQTAFSLAITLHKLEIMRKAQAMTLCAYWRQL